jgi:hypothetical protein
MNSNSGVKMGSPIQHIDYSSGKDSNKYQGDRYIPSRLCSNLNNIFFKEELFP